MLVCSLTGHSDRVWNVSWNPTGDLLASCGGDKTIRIWRKAQNSDNADGWNCSAILTDAHNRTIRSVAWSPCGNYLASGGFDATICVWRKEGLKFECIASLEGHENEVKSVGWSVCGSYLASCSRDKSVWVWAVDDQEDFECVSVLNAHSQDVKKILWHPEEKLLASASYDDTVKFHVEDGDDWSTSTILESHQSTVWSISFEKCGHRLASCSDDQTVKIWSQMFEDNGNKFQWKCTCTLSGYHNRPIYDVSWCQLTGLIATAGGDNYIRIFRECTDSLGKAAKFELVHSVHAAHTDDVNCVIWNPHLRGILASCGDDASVKIWNVDCLLEE